MKREIEINGRVYYVHHDVYFAIKDAILTIESLRYKISEIYSLNNENYKVINDSISDAIEFVNDKENIICKIKAL